MSLPWHIPLEALPCFKVKPTPPQPSLLKHYSNVSVHDTPCEELQTGLMCEIGIGNREPANIQRLISSGLTVARLNLRDLEPDACTQLVQSVRQAVYNYSAELEYVYPLGLIVDIRGPDIATGDLKAGPKSTVELLKDNFIRLTTDISWKASGTADCLYVGFDHLTELQRGDAIFIDSLAPGKIKLIAVEAGDDSVDCKISAGGTIGGRMSVRITKVPKEVPLGTVAKRDSSQSFVSNDESLSFEHMEEQLAWAVGADVDAVLIPEAQSADDVRHVRGLLGEKGKYILVFSSIDTLLAVDSIDEIIAESDGIYLDRSVLATDLPVEKIFIAQKCLLAKCQEAGKPCICKAVINEQIPALCVTDIANLIIDGCGVIALELHYDSPLNKFTQTSDALKMAEQCIAAAAVICRQAERTIWQPKVYGHHSITGVPFDDPIKTLCYSAIELTMRANAVCILCLTSSGRTAKILSYIKPYCPIVAVTRACHTTRQLRFWRGCRAMHYFEIGKANWAAETDARIHAGLDFCKAKRLIKAGDPYVVLTGSRRGIGYCDNVRLLYASARDTVPVL